MKTWKIILASVLALLILIGTPLSIVAANGQSTPTDTSQATKVHLAIVQPWIVRVGEQMQLTVLERKNQTMIGAAGVWSVPKDHVAAVRQAIKDLNHPVTANVTETQYETILNANGTKLGQTDSTGKLTYTFNDPANYWLVALKEGYWPGFSHLFVREPLAISAPQRAAPGETVTITVIQKGSSDPVSGANVWAVDFANSRDLKDKLAELRQANKGDPGKTDWDSALSGLATSLGITNANGQVTHAFLKGRYLLIATKPGCVPAYTKIVIAAPQSTPAAALNP